MISVEAARMLSMSIKGEEINSTQANVDETQVQI